MKLSLGTAQFGSRYGISNVTGQPQMDEVKDILMEAGRSDVSHLDTAPGYGSEEAIGKILGEGHGFNITTKTPSDVEKLEEAFYCSLENLKAKQLYGLLLHNAQSLNTKEGFSALQKMKTLKERGLVEKIGVSVYDSKQIKTALEMGGVDIVQVPINFLDQRLIHDGTLKKLKDLGVEVHARSVFLQGLLLMDEDSLPTHFHSVLQHLAKIRKFLDEKKMTVLQAALGFLAQLKEVDRIIVGVNAKAELVEVIKAVRNAGNIVSDVQKLSKFSAWDDENILNPALWPKR